MRQSEDGVNCPKQRRQDLCKAAELRQQAQGRLKAHVSVLLPSRPSAAPGHHDLLPRGQALAIANIFTDQSLGLCLLTFSLALRGAPGLRASGISPGKNLKATSKTSASGDQVWLSGWLL